MSADDTTSIANCSFCRGEGLPILPVRYAIARTDSKIPAPRAPVVNGPFGEGVTDVATLPDGQDYTLRLMRAGFLYVYNEAAGTWSGYVVTEKGYLYAYVKEIEHSLLVAMDPGNPTQGVSNKLKTPSSKVEFSCAANNSAHQYPGRCITIPDAANADNIYLAFSDTAWTNRVWHEHATNEVVEGTTVKRRDQMRKLSLAEWRSGQASHASSISTISQYVAEASIEELTNKQEQDSTDETGLEFSLDPVNGIADDVDNLVSWAESKSVDDVPSVMVALDDPVAIITDLNQLARVRAVKWTESPERKRKYESALMISTLERAVKNGAEIQVSENREKIFSVFSLLFPAHAGITSGDGSVSLTRFNDAVEQAGTIDDSEISQIHEDAWDKYLGMYDENKLRNFLDEEYPRQLHEFEMEQIKPLDSAYISWFDNVATVNYFLCNYDDKDIEDGSRYTSLMCNAIRDASGRTMISDYFESCLQQDPANPYALVSRGLVLNQNSLTKVWSNISEQGLTPFGGWDGMANHLYGTFKDKIIGVLGDFLEYEFKVIDDYSYELSAVFARFMHRAYDTTTGQLVASVEEYRIISLIGALAKHSAPNHQLVEVRSEPNRLQSIRILQHVTSSVSDGSKNLVGGVNEISDLFDPLSTKKYPYQGLLLLDSSQTQSFKLTNKVSPEQFSLLMQDSLNAQTRLEAGGYLIGALLSLVTLGSSLDSWKKDKSTKTFTAVSSGVASLSGIVMEGVSVSLKSSKWGRVKLSNAIRANALRASTRAELLGSAGKLVGTIGAVVGGVLAIWDGIEGYGIKPSYGAPMLILGLGMTVSGLAIFLSAWAVIGFAVSLIIALLMFVVGFLKPDKIEIWLDKCIYFGNNGNDRFEDVLEQYESMQLLSN